jgi:hypothetical protein
MELLSDLDPDDPYAHLHRAKIYAAMGDSSQAYAFLERALDGVQRLDTLHHIEFRQDLRVDPSFDGLRDESRFTGLIARYYGPDGGSGWRGEVLTPDGPVPRG